MASDCFIIYLLNEFPFIRTIRGNTNYILFIRMNKKSKEPGSKYFLPNK